MVRPGQLTAQGRHFPPAVEEARDRRAVAGAARALDDFVEHEVEDWPAES